MTPGKPKMGWITSLTKILMQENQQVQNWQVDLIIPIKLPIYNSLEVTGNPGMVSASGSAGASTELRRGAATGRRAASFRSLSSSKPIATHYTKQKDPMNNYRHPNHFIRRLFPCSNNVIWSIWKPPNNKSVLHITDPGGSLSSSSWSCFSNSASLALSGSIPTDRSNMSTPWSNVADEKTRESRSKGIFTDRCCGMYDEIMCSQCRFFDEITCSKPLSGKIRP